MDEIFKSKVEEQLELVKRKVYDKLLEEGRIKTEIGRLRNEIDIFNQLLGRGKHSKLGKTKKKKEEKSNIIPSKSP